MRVLLMLLVLANLGFFAWQHWYGADRVLDLPPGRIEDVGQRLVLVGESASGVEVEKAPVLEPSVEEEIPVEPAENLAGEDAGKNPDSPSVGMACATLGPFDERESAEIARARLNALGLDPVVRETGGQIRSGFWVYLPPFPSRDAAEEIEDELRGKNIHDLFIVNESEQRNAISLGLFSTPERADQRAAEIGRLGYAPRVAERFRDATVYWVDFEEHSGETLEPEAVGVMGAGETLPEKRPIPCVDIADGVAGP